MLRIVADYVSYLWSADKSNDFVFRDEMFTPFTAEFGPYHAAGDAGMRIAVRRSVGSLDILAPGCCGCVRSSSRIVGGVPQNNAAHDAGYGHNNNNTTRNGGRGGAAEGWIVSTETPWGSATLNFSSPSSPLTWRLSKAFSWRVAPMERMLVGLSAQSSPEGSVVGRIKVGPLSSGVKLYSGDSSNAGRVDSELSLCCPLNRRSAPSSSTGQVFRIACSASNVGREGAHVAASYVDERSGLVVAVGGQLPPQNLDGSGEPLIGVQKRWQGNLTTTLLTSLDLADPLASAAEVSVRLDPLAPSPWMPLPLTWQFSANRSREWNFGATVPFVGVTAGLGLHYSAHDSPLQNHTLRFGCSLSV